MNKKMYTMGAGILLALLGGFLAGRLSHSGSGGHDHEHEEHVDGQSSAEENVTWTCSMHPQIQQGEAGDCPICGMDLIPLEVGDGSDDGPRTMSMSESSRALANIQTTEVKRDYPAAEIRLVGRLDYDETRERSLTARVPARIEELYVNYKGIRVSKGDHLAKVYSPELLTAQRELLSAYQANPNSSFTRAAKEKLRLWDLASEQIDEIIKSGEAKDHFVLKAPIGGIVAEKHVKEGDYVKTGELLFKIVDLSRVWAYLDAYESDLPWLRFGQDVSFTVEAMPGEEFHGRIAFIEPEVNRKTRTVPVRVNVSNPDFALKPGMFVRGIVKSHLGEDGKVVAPEFAGKWISPMHPEIIKDGPGQCDVCGMDLVPAEELGYVDNSTGGAPLILPTSAVLRTGKRAVVYVEKNGAKKPTYEGREIVLGPRAGDFFLVSDGLEEGDRVVTNGAFKIDSALQIQAKPSMMNPEENEAVEEIVKSISLSEEIVVPLIQHYISMQKALAADDFESAKTEAKAMMKITGHSGEIANLIHTMLDAQSIDEMRKPHFEILSNSLIDVLKAKPDLLEESLYIMHCPMVYGNTGADWLQDNDQLRNPYFGSMMLKCGEVKEELRVE